MLLLMRLRMQWAIRGQIVFIYNPPAAGPLREETGYGMRAKVIRKSGFTLVEIMIVVAIIGLLAAIAIPNFVKARTTSQLDACLNNLRQIDGAAQTYALENNKQPTSAYIMSDIKPYLHLDRNGNLPQCPAGGTYGPGFTFGSPPTCSIATHVFP
jgi:prepilin-type N-terminal cleavage/methylation domain-containing protein